MEKKKRFLVSAAYYLTIAGGVYLVFKYAIFIVMPFLIGFLIAAVLSPLTRLLTGQFHMKHRPSAIFILLLFYATVGLLTSVLAVQLTLKLGELSRQLPTLYKSNIEPALTSIIGAINDLVARFSDKLDPDFAMTVSGLLDSAKSSLGGAVSNISVRLLTKLSSFAASIPKFIIELVFAVIASFFFICDFDKIIGYARSRLPKRAVGIISEFSQKLLLIGTKYLRSYVLIMLITFAELFFGLAVIGTKNALIWAMVIAILDFLPVIGSGTVMIPWALMDFILGNVGHGVGVLAVWGVITLVRNIIEPKILGKQMGMHPLVTLIAMFVGTKLFGFVGLILFPVGVSVAVPVIGERIRERRDQ